MEILLKSKQNKQSERQHINIQIDIKTPFFQGGYVQQVIEMVGYIYIYIYIYYIHV